MTRKEKERQHIKGEEKEENKQKPVKKQNPKDTKETKGQAMDGTEDGSKIEHLKRSKCSLLLEYQLEEYNSRVDQDGCMIGRRKNGRKGPETERRHRQEHKDMSFQDSEGRKRNGK